MGKTKIYIFAIYTGRKSCVRDSEPCGDTIGYAIANKEVVESHYSSGIEWTKHDMGITSDWKHDTYKEKFPDGYELVWLGGFNSMEEAEKVLDNIYAS